ncbi:hypothetical protein [Burkholderia ubonensis]|uniref:hypothetical protein n=1 Tax=Burkholderia ubonensis TaxID=101571 RepID=UPI00075DAD0B|nr:hypothetical protein [Burkholderia ubonensis]KVP62165.1 hypothetical protein WJ90_26090 [Burkholderia ubonensis]
MNWNLTAAQRAALEFALGACAGHPAGEAHVAALESLLSVPPIRTAVDHAAQADTGQHAPRTNVTDDDKLCADRYRYARDNIQEGHELPGGYWLSDTGDAWDKTIDAAIKDCRACRTGEAR